MCRVGWVLLAATATAAAAAASTLKLPPFAAAGAAATAGFPWHVNLSWARAGNAWGP
jgi:hypothetical protein